MAEFKVRVPIAGYVEIEVEADTRLDAMRKARDNFSSHLSPRDGVTDLDALVNVPEMVLEAVSRVKSYGSWNCVLKDNYDYYDLEIVGNGK